MKRWRHLLIAIAAVPAIALYAVFCMFLADYVTGLHWLLDSLFIWPLALHGSIRQALLSAGLPAMKPEKFCLCPACKKAIFFALLPVDLWNSFCRYSKEQCFCAAQDQARFIRLS